MHKPPLPSRSLECARALRQHGTEAERKLWSCLRSSQLDGLKFRRQHAVPPYVVDFCCPAIGLVVELDGSQHSEETDQVRTRYLQSQGLFVLRFWNNDVLQQTDAVIAAILAFAGSRTLTPTPLPEGEGLNPKSDAP